MRLSSILCLLVVLSLPAVSWAQAKTPQTPATQASADAGAPPAQPTAPNTPIASPTQPSEHAAPSTEVAPSTDAPTTTTTTTTTTTPASATEPASPTTPAADAGVPAAPSGGDAAAQPDAGSIAPEAVIPSPGELGDRLVGDLPPQSDQKPGWTAPVPVLTLHGYFRTRGELQDHFWLGRGPNNIVYAKDAANPAYAGVTLPGLGPDPFTKFRPLERQNPQSQCSHDGFTTDDVGTVCKVNSLQYANVRFRLSPQINISEDIRIKSTFDILDNYTLGHGAQSFYGLGRPGDTAFPGTNNPTGSLIVPRRVWAEVRNRDLGELRFGLMPEQWGLGMLYNAGNGLDDDYSTDLGRVMATTKLFGFYLSASYDFMSEGLANIASKGEYRPDLDASQLDDLDQFTFSVVRRVPDEDEDTVLARGDLLLNGGVHFQLRHQDSVVRSDNKTMQSLNGSFYTPDVWGQLRYGKLRLEVEAAWVLGKMRNLTLDNDSMQHISQFGAAFESELRLIGDKLGLFLYTGVATGDSSVEGLSPDANYFDTSANPGDAATNNSTVSTFRFHPSYRVDFILWRTILQQVTGAWYVKPGISYDFVRDNFGQQFGARIDGIYSRATSSVQTWGNDPNLGIELDGQIYWHSADGPEKVDGYHAALQYGVLFPLRGLGYYYKDAKLDTAQTLRLLLGVVF